MDVDEVEVGSLYDLQKVVRWEDQSRELHISVKDSISLHDAEKLWSYVSTAGGHGILQNIEMLRGKREALLAGTGFFRISRCSGGSRRLGCSSRRSWGSCEAGWRTSTSKSPPSTTRRVGFKPTWTLEIVAYDAATSRSSWMVPLHIWTLIWYDSICSWLIALM
jgi:hypothetical protein